MNIEVGNYFWIREVTNYDKLPLFYTHAKKGLFED